MDVKAQGESIVANNKEYREGQVLGDQLQLMRSAMNNPNYKKNIAGSSEGWAMSLPFGVGKVAQHLYSKEDQEAFGNVNTAFGDIQSTFAARFKGAYSGKVDKLVKNLKPDASDTWAVQNGKVVGRPVDVLIEPGGTMYISDDRAGAIYRVSRT